MHLFNHYYSLTFPLVLPSGKNNILDLSSPGIIPRRLASVMKEIASELTLVLPFVYSPQEREILIKISRSTSLNDIEVIAKSISLIPRTGLQCYLTHLAFNILK